MTRRRRRRRLGAGLLAFGLFGIGLVVAAGVLVLGSLAAVNDAATGFERQRTEIVAMLEPASAALDDAASSAENAGGSLSETSDAARRASELTSRLASSFEGLESLGSFEILGSRPFASMATQFASVAEESRSLSTDLTEAADSMSTNIADSQAVAADLRLLADQLGRLEDSLDTGAAPVNASLPVDAARIVLLGLLAWFAIPALASIWLGARLVRTGPTTAERKPARRRREG